MKATDEQIARVKRLVHVLDFGQREALTAVLAELTEAREELAEAAAGLECAPQNVGVIAVATAACYRSAKKELTELRGLRDAVERTKSQPNWESFHAVWLSEVMLALAKCK